MALAEQAATLIGANLVTLLTRATRAGSTAIARGRAVVLFHHCFRAVRQLSEAFGAVSVAADLLVQLQ